MTNLTKNAIKASFLKLLNQRPLSQITVKDIVSDCGVNRNTFYYHYQDIPQLLEDIILENTDDLIKQYGPADDIESCLEIIVQNALLNRKAIYHIYHSINREMYEQYLWNMCEHLTGAYAETLLKDRNVTCQDRDIICRYLKCLCFGIISDWLSEGMSEDIRWQLSRICQIKKGTLEMMISNCEKNNSGQ